MSKNERYLVEGELNLDNKCKSFKNNVRRTQRSYIKLKKEIFPKKKEGTDERIKEK